MAKKSAPVKPKNAWLGVPYAADMTAEKLASMNAPTQASVNQAAAIAEPIPEELALKATGLTMPGGLKANEGNAKIEEQNAVKNLTVENTYLSPEDYNTLVMAAEQTEPVQRRKQELEALDAFNQETINAIPAQTDLSPLMALADQWSGSNLSKAYRKPSTTEDRAKLLMDYGAKTEGNRQKLLNEVLKAAQYMKSGTATDQLTQMLGGSQMLGAQAFDPRPRGTGSGRGQAVDEWKVIQEGNKVAKDFQESNSRLDAVSSALASGQLGDVKRALSLAARELSGEKGVLTDQDIGRVLPQTVGMSVDQFTAYIMNDPNIQIDGKVLQGLRAELPKARARLAARNRAKLQTLQDGMGASGSFRGKTAILDPFKKSFDNASANEPKPEPSLKDLFKERLKKGTPK